ncbi:MAG: uroporphyrinogen-III C-methyltransferase [Desulfobacterales bacterium]|nr:uroporphyrinogen-III C-methyltransferase [Desulfobacterales bacterium]
MKLQKGKVYLVGAGPGDPGLITVKGLQCIQQADVIIYDFLAAPQLLKSAAKDAEIIYVGKKGGDHTLSQGGINALIVKKAQEGLAVTRLKGGDPFIFGRGGEEAETLVENDIPFEIVPGVSSAIAAPAYAGIPLTHRTFNSTLAFITGHEDPAKDASRINWEALAKGIETIVFLMGVKNLPNITRRLVEHGMAPDTPVALVQWGTTPRQKTVTGTLRNIVEQVQSAGLSSPAITVVGHVVQLRETLKWFETRPLMGKEIIVTRAREQASDLVNLLSDLGAQCLECPTIKVVPPDDFAPLDRAIENIGAYDWLIFTSINGVNFFFERLYALGKDVRVLHQLKTASIGPATSGRLLEFGIRSDILPESFRAESIVAAFSSRNVDRCRILLPRAKEARPILPVELRKMGALVDEVAAYRTRADRENVDQLLTCLEEKSIDLITFTSSSTVSNFKSLLPAEKFEALMAGVTVAVIGPITEETARKLGFDVHIVADTFTIEGLCDAIVRYYTQ